MAVRYKVQPLSRNNIRRYAKTLRKKLGLESVGCVDIVWIAEMIFPELFKREGYQFLVLSQEEMGNNHGLTNPDTGTVRIREDVYERACQGKGRDRMTIAHELGHFLLHKGVALGLARAEAHEQIPPYRDPEWQAAAFAGEFLMDSDIIRDMSPVRISEVCGVSLEAALIQKRAIK